MGLSSILIPIAAAGTPLEKDAQPLGADGNHDLRVDLTPPIFPPNPLISPTGGITLTNSKPTFDWEDAADPDGVISYTLLISGSGAFTSIWGQTTTARVVITASIYTPTEALPNDVYTWTIQAQDPLGNVSGYVTPTTFVLEAVLSSVYLPVLFRPLPAPTCPTTSIRNFERIPFSGPPADHPDYLHGDLNLSLRGYVATTAFLGLVDYSGSTDLNAPQLAGLFSPNRLSNFRAVYRVNGWDWGCGEHGCPGPPIANPIVTLAALATTPAEPIYIPERSPGIFGDYKAMVLYADARRITLGYTRQDTVANGYAVHIENVCVDPNLLTLYRAQVSTDGWHVTGQLPALRNNQVLGTALGTEIQVAIRDRGTFGDPRSRKDWWQGY